MAQTSRLAAHEHNTTNIFVQTNMEVKENLNRKEEEGDSDNGTRRGGGEEGYCITVKRYNIRKSVKLVTTKQMCLHITKEQTCALDEWNVVNKTNL